MIARPMNHSASSRSHPGGPTFAIILLGVGGLAVTFGWPSLSGEFLDGDDIGLIRDHFLINHPSLQHAVQLLAMVHGDLYQPVPMLTFMANYAIGADNPWGYHVVNIALHAVNAALAALLAWRLAGCPRIGFLVGAMFACHPFAMEPVAWVTGRIILLAALFALITLLAFTLRDTRPGISWSIVVCGSWLLSLLSKVLPSVPLAAGWCDAHVYPTRPRRWWITVGVLLLQTAGLSALAWYTTSRLHYFAMMQAEASTSWPARVLLASRYYFENYLWPTRLSAWSPPPQSVPFFSGPVVVGALEWLFLIGIMFISWRWCRAAFVGIGLFILLLMPFLAAMTARTFLTADRYMYLPIIGLHLAVAAWAVRLFDVLSRRTPVLLRAPVGVAIATALVLWIVQGRSVAAVFHDNWSQIHRALDLYPDDIRAWVELARTHVKYAEEQFLAGDAQRGRELAREAIKVIDKCRRDKGEDPALLAQAGEAHYWLGEYALAERELRQALAGLPRKNEARYYLGLSMASLGRTDEARRLWIEILNDKDQFLPAATALARSYQNAGELDQAIEWYERAIALNAHHRASLLNLATIRMSRGEWPTAEALLRQVLYISPHDPDAMLHLAAVRDQQGDMAGALDLLEDFCRLYPDRPDARSQRAAHLASLRRTREAEHAYRETLRRWPGHRASATGLSELLRATGRYAELRDLWAGLRKAANPPDDAAAWEALGTALAGDPQSALGVLDSIQPSQPGHVMASWIRVWIRMTASPPDPEATLAALNSAVQRPVDTEWDRQGLTAVAASMADWSREHADDPSGYYIIARAMTCRGDRPADVRRFAERAAALDRSGPWGERAREFLSKTP